MRSRRWMTLALIVFLMLPLSGSILAQHLPLSEAIVSSWYIGVVDEPGDVGQFSSLALDSIDQPHISYYDAANGDLKYAHFDGAVWQVVTVDSADDVGYSGALALDSSGWPHIAYCRLYLTPYGAPCDELRHAYYDGAVWHIETVAIGGEAGPSISLALDANDHPHISYCRLVLSGGWPRPSFSCHALRYAYHDGGAWRIETVEGVGQVGAATSLAIDSANRPHISYTYYDAAGDDLRYAWYNGSAWFTETVDSAGDVGHCSSLALDGHDQPRISYYDGTNDDLKYAHRNGTEWQIETVDSTGNVGACSSLALDAQMFAHVAYFDVSNSHLKYARHTGVIWQIETVDSSESVGRYASLAVDSDGLVRITYYDEANRDLKYAEQIIPSYIFEMHLPLVMKGNP